MASVFSASKQYSLQSRERPCAPAIWGEASTDKNKHFQRGKRQDESHIEELYFEQGTFK